MSPWMAPRREAITPWMRGPATRHSTTNRNPNVIASQNSWLGKVVVSNGGKPAPSFWAGTSVVAVVAASAMLKSEREQDQQRDDQAEQAGRFAQREAEEQVGGLAGGSARIAQRAREVRAEH